MGWPAQRFWSAVLTILDTDRRAEKCVLHIGLEKTGTSTIQTFLTDNRELYREEAVLYPRVGGGEAGGSNWGFAALACPAPWDMDIGRFLGLRSQADLDAYRSSVVEELALEFSRSDRVERLIVSSEHFHSRLRSVGEIAALRSFMERWAESFQVVLYLRRQDRIATSLYSTHIRSGQPRPTPYLPTAGKDLPYYYDYESLYRNWAAVFGNEAMTVRIFDEFAGGSLLTDFTTACDLSLSGKSIPAPINTSIDARGSEFLTEVNRQIGDSDRVMARWTGLSLSRLRKGKTFPFARNDAQRFYEQFSDSNERLRQLALPDRSTALFDDSFDEYPEVLAPEERRYEDAVAVAIQLIDEMLPNRSPVFTSYPTEAKTVALIRWLRPDLCRQFPIADEREWRDFLDWLVFNGLGEYPALFEDETFRSYLTSVEPDDCVHRLKRLIHSYRPDVGLNLPLPEKRIEFEEWFDVQGVEEFRLRPLLRPDPRRQEEELPFGVNLIGHAYGQLGTGEDVRMAGRALLACGVPFSIINFEPGSRVPQDEFSMIDHVTEEGPYPFNLFCMTAREHGRYVAERGTKQLRGRFNIGYWPWELSKWPHEWEPLAPFVDEVWVSSRHTYEALAPGCPVSVNRMSMAVELGSIASKGRSEFGLPTDALLFCFSFDLNSSIHRKNPRACLEAFRRAFRMGEDVGLVIKANRTGHFDSEWERLKQDTDEDPRIHVIEDNLERPDLLALYKCCDCFLSLHRAEGFGRGIAEALQLGLHVITTGYSGNVDFCERPGADLVDYKLVDVEDGQYPFGAGQVWAEPDVNHAAELMQKFAVAGRSEAGPDVGEWREFSPRVIGQSYEERLRAIQENDED